LTKLANSSDIAVHKTINSIVDKVD
jgi:hypothetical protein